MSNEDHQRRSFAAKKSRGALAKALGFVGPGLITGAADDDPAGIVTDLQAGARFQYALAWTTLVQFPMLVALQLMAARIALVTGRDVAGVVAHHYPRWVLWGACALLVVANTITGGAEIAAIAAGVKLIAGIPERWTIPTLTLVLPVAIVFGSYHIIVATMKWCALALLGYVAAGFLAHPAWGDVLRQTFVPNVRFTRDYLTMFVAVFGGTISPWMVVWQSAEEVEELRESHKRPLRARPWAARRELTRVRRDTVAGMAISQLIEFFIIVAAGAVIFPTGVRQIDTARQAAQALHPIGQGAGETLFAIAVIGTGLIAVPTLTGSSAYAIAAAMRWPAGIGEPAMQAKGFNGVIVLGTLVAGAIAMFSRNAMRLQVASQVLNGLLMPPLIVLLLVVANDRTILGRRTNGWLTNALGVATTLVMSVPALCLVIWWLWDLP